MVILELEFEHSFTGIRGLSCELGEIFALLWPPNKRQNGYLKVSRREDNKAKEYQFALINRE